MNVNVPVVLATAVFALFLVWQFRPAFGLGRVSKHKRDALRAAEVRVERATSDAERVRALCDAADVSAHTLGRTRETVKLFLQAMRVDPASADVVERACAALGRRPRALEALLWRRLAAMPWSGPSRAATEIALERLAALYEGPRRNAVRARALHHALLVLREPAAR